MCCKVNVDQKKSVIFNKVLKRKKITAVFYYTKEYLDIIFFWKQKLSMCMFIVKSLTEKKNTIKIVSSRGLYRKNNVDWDGKLSK